MIRSNGRMGVATALVLAVWMLPAAASTQAFRDDFSGTTLDTAIWTVAQGDGHVVVDGGFMTLSCPGSTFPAVTSMPGLFPEMGDFVVRVGMRYLSQARCGDGFGAMEWACINGTYHFSMDGVPGASGACATRATRVFFGHPHPITCSPWSSFAVDFIEITPAGPTDILRSSWSRLKAAYR